MLLNCTCVDLCKSGGFCFLLLYCVGGCLGVKNAKRVVALAGTYIIVLNLICFISNKFVVLQWMMFMISHFKVLQKIAS